MSVVIVLTAPDTPAQTPVGETLEVQLEDISTTGYRWSVQAIDPPIVVLREEAATPGASPGAAGVRRFLFLTVKTGQVVLGFDLRRPWESGGPPLKHYSLDLQIR